jgi:hypothetical protein
MPSVIKRNGAWSGEHGRRWSQLDDPTVSSGPAAGPLSCGFGGAPRGIRTPNRQIRSLVLRVPACPRDPLAYPFLLLSGHIPEAGRTLIPSRHARLGRKVVAVSAGRSETQHLGTVGHPVAISAPEHQILDLVV